MIIDIALSPAQRTKAVASGLIVVDSRSRVARQTREKLMEPGRKTIEELKAKNAQLDLKRQELERKVYLRDQKVERMREDIGAKIEEVKSLRNDANANVCDAAIEAFKECIELLDAP